MTSVRPTPRRRASGSVPTEKMLATPRWMRQPDGADDAPVALGDEHVERAALALGAHRADDLHRHRRRVPRLLAVHAVHREGERVPRRLVRARAASITPGARGLQQRPVERHGDQPIAHEAAPAQQRRQRLGHVGAVERELQVARADGAQRLLQRLERLVERLLAQPRAPHQVGVVHVREGRLADDAPEARRQHLGAGLGERVLGERDAIGDR